MRYIALGLSLLIGSMAVAGEITLRDLRVMAGKPAEVFNKEWPKIKKSIKAIHAEKDPIKKMEMIDKEGQRLMGRAQALLTYIQEMEISPDLTLVDKKKLIKLIKDSKEYNTFKKQWDNVKATLKKIKTELDPRKRAKMLEAEGQRLIGKGKEVVKEMKESAKRIKGLFKMPKPKKAPLRRPQSA